MDRSCFVLVLAAVAIGVSEAGAQTADGTREEIARRATTGDRLTITTVGGRNSQGRLNRLEDDLLVLQTASGDLSFSYGEIDRVRRRQNGILLGTIIGTAAGVAAGVPLRLLSKNEVGGGGQILALCIAGGAAAGLGIDAIFGSNRTIYRKPRTVRSSFGVQPQRRGASVNWTAEW
jgi:hypothetical protein